MKRVAYTLFLVCCLLLGFAASAFAASGPIAVDSTLNELADAVYNGFKAGHYGDMAMALIVLVVAGLSKYGSRVHKWFGTGHAKRLLLLVSTVAASLYVNGISAGHVWDALKLAAMAGGTVSIVQWIAEWLVARSWVPNWARLALVGILWIFRPRGGDAVKAAESAGERAVEANPPAGAGDVGKWP